MFRSMTAFGRATADVGDRQITVEIRSVNNRYLDCAVRLPRSMSYLEEKVKPYILSRGVSRGKVEVTVSVQSAAEEEPVIREALEKVVQACEVMITEDTRTAMNRFNG